MKKYLANWWTIIIRPIYFYTKLKEESWQEQALTFFLITAWILGLVAALTVFVVQYIPIGNTLVEGFAGYKFVLILPVLITLALVFFMITFLILGGFFSFVFFVAFFLIGYLLHYVYHLLGGKGHLNRMIQSMLYSSAILVMVGLTILLIIPTRFGALDYSIFRVGFNLIYYFILLYIYGLWAIAGRKTYGVPRWKAFLGAMVPIIILLIFGVLFDKIALPILQPWIS